MLGGEPQGRAGSEKQKAGTARRGREAPRHGIKNEDGKPALAKGPSQEKSGMEIRSQDPKA